MELRMASKKKQKLTLGNKAHIIDGSEKMTTIDVLKTVDEWSTYKLADGTAIKVKPIIIHIKRVVGKFDPNGDPIYFVQAGMAVDAQVPSRLKKKKR